MVQLSYQEKAAQFQTLAKFRNLTSLQLDGYFDEAEEWQLPLWSTLTALKMDSYSGRAPLVQLSGLRSLELGSVSSCP